MKNYEEAYVEDPEGGSDYFVFGLQDRNRAFPGDVVAVRPKEREECLVSKSKKKYIRIWGVPFHCQ